MLAHEIWHCILLHGLRRQGRDGVRFNYAADLEIYFLLREEGLDIPFHLPYLAEWERRRLCAEEIYDRLPELEKAMKEGGKYKRGRESANIKAAGEGKGFDKHAEQADPGAERGAARGARDAGGGEAYFDDDYLPGWRRAAAEAMREKIVAAAWRAGRTAGKLSARLQSVVEAALKPEIRWQDLLARFVSSCCGGPRRWLPPNRRYAWRGLYLQSSRTARLRAVVAVDTSGSTMECLPEFFSELDSLLKSFGNCETTVIQADSAVRSVRTFDDAAPYDGSAIWQTAGHGGTDFRPVFDYVASNTSIDPLCLVYMTDGRGPAPASPPPYPVVWVLARDGVPPAPWGCVVKFCRP